MWQIQFIDQMLVSSRLWLYKWQLPWDYSENWKTARVRRETVQEEDTGGSLQERLYHSLMGAKACVLFSI